MFEYNMGILYSNSCMQCIWIQYGDIVSKSLYAVYRYIWGLWCLNTIWGYCIQIFGYSVSVYQYLGSVVFEYNMGILCSNICMQYIWIQYGDIVSKYLYTVSVGISISGGLYQCWCLYTAYGM